MKFKILLACVVCFVSGISHADPVGTAFTYQGQLAVSGVPANGNYDFIFALYNSSSSGNEIGSPVVTNGLPVSNGLFNTSLDFGSHFNGTASWLAISVRTNNAGNYIVLTPRQALTPTPNALFATGAANAASVVNGSITSAAIANGAITSANIGSGQVVRSLNGLQDAVTLAHGNNVTITPSGNTLTIAAASSGANWSLTGNAGTTPGTDFLGTTDNQPLELWVGGSRALRLEPNANGPNVIGGFSGNSVGGGAYGATIAGGGVAGSANQVSANVSTIGGGLLNTIQATSSTIAGGYNNTIQGTSSGSSIGGGEANLIQNIYGTIPGGYGNAVTGPYSFAAGKNATASGFGSFVWGDGNAPTASTGDHQFVVRCTGGANFFTANGTSTGVQLAAGGGSWSSLSDRNAKDNFDLVNAEAVLEKVAAMPISTWSYKTENQNIRHLGPMAQDFYAAFGVGEDNRHITTIDSEGVALAAIKGLNQKLDEQIGAKDAEIERLQQTVAQLEDMVKKLAATQKASEQK